MCVSAAAKENQTSDAITLAHAAGIPKIYGVPIDTIQEVPLDVIENGGERGGAAIPFLPQPLRLRRFPSGINAAQPPFRRRLAELYRQKVAHLQEALAEPEARTEALEILRSLIERIVLHPAESGLEIELIGEIAAMIDLGTSKKAGSFEPAVPEAYRRSVKVVAGTRNHLDLLLSAAMPRP